MILRYKPALRLNETKYFVASSSLVATGNLLRLLLKKEQVSAYAEFSSSESPCWKTYQKSIGATVHFNSSFNQRMIPRHYLTQPLTSSDPIIYQNMLRLCKTQKSTPYYGEGLEAQVSMVIVENHYHSLAIDRVATELSMSERSLRRRLNQSDSSYTIFVDDLRESKAPAFLAIKGLPVSTIAYELGFNDPSNFARTFKRWTKYSTQESR